MYEVEGGVVVFEAFCKLGGVRGRGRCRAGGEEEEREKDRQIFGKPKEKPKN